MKFEEMRGLSALFARRVAILTTEGIACQSALFAPASDRGPSFSAFVHTTSANRTYHYVKTSPKGLVRVRNFRPGVMRSSTVGDLSARFPQLRCSRPADQRGLLKARRWDAEGLRE